jgi:hypothetical protein
MLMAPQPTDEIDAVDEALAWHEGDVRTTIATLLKDCAFLREQLLLARSALSHGMTRGRLPQTERLD